MADDSFLNPVRSTAITPAFLPGFDPISGGGGLGGIFDDLEFLGKDKFGNLLDEVTQGWIDSSGLKDILDALFLGGNEHNKPHVLPADIAIDMVENQQISSIVIRCIELYSVTETSLFDPTAGKTKPTNENGDDSNSLREKIKNLNIARALGKAGDFVEDKISLMRSELADILRKEADIKTDDDALTNPPGQEANMDGEKTPMPALAVRLPMPGNIENEMKHNYSAVETGSLGADLMRLKMKTTNALKNADGYKDMLKVMQNGYEDGTGIDTTGTQKKMAENRGGLLLGSDAKNVMMLESKQLVNSKREMLYKGHEFRNFSFKFDFIPRNEAEVLKTAALIKGLKYFSTPFLDAGAEVVNFPSLFRIEFINRLGVTATEDFGMKIGECALTSMSVNYTPDGLFQTFRNGFPLRVVMTLGFQETELMYRDTIIPKDGGGLY